jgi:hypothetical protein
MKGQRKCWKDTDNHREFLDRLGDQLGLKKISDWYDITRQQIASKGGSGILRKYGESHSKLIMSVYSKHNWSSFCFNVGSGYWDVSYNRKDFLDNLGSKLGFKTMDNWYSITVAEILEGGGYRPLVKYGGSPSKLVMSSYPNYRWITSKFRSREARMPKGYYDDINNRITLVHQWQKELRIKDLCDWYRISSSQLFAVHKNRILFVKYPLEVMLREAYPQHEWNGGSILSGKHYKGNKPFFSARQDMEEELKYFVHSNWFGREFLDNLGNKLNYKILVDFHHLNLKDIKTFGGTAFFEECYTNSCYEALKDAYPNHKWFEWKLSQNVRPGFWENRDNHREFLDELGNQLLFKEIEDWYTITRKQIAENGGASLVQWKYGNSPYKLITSVYSCHNWNPTSFNIGHGYWDKNYNRKDFLDNLGKQLGYKKMEDWYYITRRQIIMNGGYGVLRKYDNLPSTLVTSVYQNHKWNQEASKLCMDLGASKPIKRDIYLKYNWVV